MALKPVSKGAAVVACSTCRYAAEQRTDAVGMAGGARLVEALRRVRESDPGYDAVAVQEMPCLFACQDFCAVHLRAPGKIGYVLGRFTPSEHSARAILDYAVRYAASEIGQVPYRDWPEGVKDHFLTRTPPAGFVVE